MNSHEYYDNIKDYLNNMKLSDSIPLHKIVKGENIALFVSCVEFYNANTKKYPVRIKDGYLEKCSRDAIRINVEPILKPVQETLVPEWTPTITDIKKGLRSPESNSFKIWYRSWRRYRNGFAKDTCIYHMKKIIENENT